MKESRGNAVIKPDWHKTDCFAPRISAASYIIISLPDSSA